MIDPNEFYKTNLNNDSEESMAEVEREREEYDEFDARQKSRGGDPSITPDQDYVLPRHDLRVEAFRKYEPFIADATKGTIVVDCLPNMTNKTFCTRFKDAILGFKRYHYYTTMFDMSYPLDRIKAYPLASGRIKLENKEQDYLNQEKSRQLSAGLPNVSDRTKFLAVIKHKQADLSLVSVPQLFPYSTDSDLIFLRDLLPRMGLCGLVNTTSKLVEIKDWYSKDQRPADQEFIG